MILDDGTTILLKRKFNTNVENLFNCFSSVAAWKEWWTGLDIMKMGFEEGGEIHFSWKHSKARKHGKILEIKPNELFRFTWSSGDYPNDPNDACTTPIRNTEVTLKFSQLDDGRSELQLMHQLMTTDHNLNGHYEGWTWALLDLDKALNAEARKSRDELSVAVSREFNAPIDKVFELWTKPELLNKWFNSKDGTRSYTYSDLKENGCFGLDYHDVEGKETGIPRAIFRVIGEYKEIIPNKKLVFSWIDESFNYESLVTVCFESLGNNTKVDLVHSNVYESDWIKRFTEGWNECLEVQDALLQQ